MLVVKKFLNGEYCIGMLDWLVDVVYWLVIMIDKNEFFGIM